MFEIPGRAGALDIDAAALFGAGDLTRWRERLFELCYTAHGGSGLNFTLDPRDLDISDAEWMIDELGRRRRAEAQAMKPKGK
ncbi:MAG: hypothetical protein KKH12_16085 [Gammaproteobacteria bacterium]|nr:hypothetical protein [Gammaproteobacteria bacterium]